MLPNSNVIRKTWKLFNLLMILFEMNLSLQHKQLASTSYFFFNVWVRMLLDTSSCILFIDCWCEFLELSSILLCISILMSTACRPCITAQRVLHLYPTSMLTVSKQNINAVVCCFDQVQVLVLPMWLHGVRDWDESSCVVMSQEQWER